MTKSKPTLQESLDALENDILKQVIREFSDQKYMAHKVAERLGVSVSTLYSKMEKHGLYFE